MYLKVLVDNNTYIDCYHYGEPAVSYYIKDGDRKILFDAGYSDLLRIPIREVGVGMELNLV